MYCNYAGNCMEPLQFCSSLQYTYIGSENAHFTLNEGCYDDDSCSGKIKVVLISTSSPTV